MTSKVPPQLTYEQRRENLRRANEARRERTKLLAALKAGERTVTSVITSDEHVCKRLPVFTMLMALPNMGPRRTAEVMLGAKIDRHRRVGGLGPHQREALLQWADGR